MDHRRSTADVAYDASEAAWEEPATEVQPALAGRLAGLSLPRQVLVLAVWPMLEQFLNFLVGTVDLVLAARLERIGEAAAAALGVGGYIGWLMGLLHMAVGVGGAALVARAVGGRHQRLANAALGQAVLLAVFAGAVLGVLVFAGAGPIARLAGAEGEALALCVLYLRIIALAAPLSAVLFVGGACLRGAGDTLTPFWVMVGVNIVNVGTSVWFVQLGWGVAGIALGTLLAWTLGAGLILAMLFRGSRDMRLRWMRLRPHWHTARRIVRVGVPNLIESSGMWLGNFAVLMIVGRLPLWDLAPQHIIGVHMIAIRLESVSFLMGAAIGTAAATLAGQYLGAGQPRRAKQAVGLCWAVATVLMVLIGLTFIFAPELWTRLISDKPLHLNEAPPVLRIAGFIQIFFATYIVLSHALRGAGDTTTAMKMTYASTFLVRLPAAYIIAVPLGWGFYGIWLGLCGELAVRAALFAGRYFHGGWTRVEV
ncbi:MAG: MATE family efflux transporter [Phycisphaeraceae bacterium]